MLFGLRTKTARTFKANFSNLYGRKIACPLNCWNTKYNELAPPDNQEHLLLCENIKLSSNNISRSKTEYSNLFGDIIKQKEIITLFTELLEERQKSLNEAEDPPGDKLDPSTSSSKCCKSTKFTHSIICNDGIFIENKWWWWWSTILSNLGWKEFGWKKYKVSKKMCRSFCLTSLPANMLLEGRGIFYLKGGIHSIASSGVQKFFCTILGSRDISKSKWCIRFLKNMEIMINLISLYLIPPHLSNSRLSL